MRRTNYKAPHYAVFSRTYAPKELIHNNATQV